MSDNELIEEEHFSLGLGRKRDPSGKSQSEKADANGPRESADTNKLLTES